MFLAAAAPSLANAASPPQIGEAARLALAGKAHAAEAELERLLAAGAPRLPTLGELLEICAHNRDEACVIRHAPQFAEAALAEPGADVLRAERAREAAYFLAQANLAAGVNARAILSDPTWRQENAYNGELYLRRQVLASKLLLSIGDRAELDRAINRILSLVASLKNPEAARYTIAGALADMLGTLLQIGETERAWGLYRASGAQIAQALPPLTLDAALYRYTEAQLLQGVGDLAGSAKALDAAVATLRAIELDDSLRQRLLAPALTLKAAVHAASGDVAGARAALDGHPFAKHYAQAGRTPASYDEVTYLAARTLVAAAEAASDPIASQALAAPLAFSMDPATARRAEIYRAAGAALSASAGDRQVKLGELARRIRAAATSGNPELSGRPGALDLVLTGLALSQAPDAPQTVDANTAFALMQLVGRTGLSFDSDALTALGRAKSELQRRTVHQALRLRARRDRVERTQIHKILASTLAAAPAVAVLEHDSASRLVIRDFDVRIAQAERDLANGGLALGGEPIAPLAKLQSVLAPNEAALAVAPTVGGLAYMCVRRDGVRRALAPVDAVKLKLDTRLLQAALTATYAPSEALDAQFPVEAAVRLYGVFIRPFEPCLKPGDRIIWLAGVALSDVPLAALLPSAPPKLERGYDLASADWLVRRHAISYAGSASVIVATRSSRFRAGADFDFLGVGDPILSGKTAEGEDRAQVVLRGLRGEGRLASLAPLPETKDELEASARGFRTARLLLQEAATERGVRAQMLGAYRYISFATHGLLRDEVQGLNEPALALTPVSARDPDDDGLLTASEIADLDLRARFVALSACNTANFDLTQLAQDLPALASAFAVAGTPATLATLWPVNSETGKQVVSDVFARLRAAATGPGDALAEAQRAFLAAPPSRAYLHPRFWAPFVVLGDGGALMAERAKTAGPGLTAVEVMTKAGGEVLSLDRAEDKLAARLIADADGSGRHEAALRLAGSDGVELWRSTEPDTGASRMLVRLGSYLVTGGYELSPTGRYAPVLQAYDVESGAPARRWRGDGLARVDAFILAGAATGPASAVIAVGELNLRDPPQAGGGRMHVLQVDEGLAPRPLFDVVAPPGVKLSDATLTPMGPMLLVTYTGEEAIPAQPNTWNRWDDYETPYCTARRITWLELREATTGKLVRSGTIENFTAVAAIARQGTALIGGSRSGACGEDKASVVALDAGLRFRTVYTDDSLGASQVRAMSGRGDGETVVVASKENVVDYQPPAPAAAATADPFAIRPFQRSYSGMVLSLGRNGATREPKLLDSGANIYVDALETGRPGEILVGGALAGQAAIFRLSK